jgi:hypothetical protein
MADLAVVKKAVQKSRGVLQALYLPEHFRLTAVLFGTAILAFCGLMALFLARWNGYGTIPAGVRTAYWVAAALAFLAVGLVKQSSLWKVFRSLQPGSPFAALYREVFSLVGANHLYVGLMICVLFLVTFLCLKGQALLIIPGLSVVAGLALNGIGSTFRLRGYLAMGYWLILSGLASSVFFASSPLAAVCLTFGVGAVIFGVYGFLRRPSGGGN